uniref:Uncharacterized protein n=1 Tax=Anguilla anguilla TaxID=7936 RepID=A0A0E9TLR5_ANGAN
MTSEYAKEIFDLSEGQRGEILSCRITCTNNLT